jgi:hypothetical protein
MNKTLVYVGIGIAALLLFSKNASASTGNFDLSPLNDQYGADNVQRLNNLLAVLLTKGLSDEQIKFLLAQALHETGLFGNNPNYLSIDTRHNYAGISHGGSISYYDSIDSFVDDWLTVLNKGALPLNASSATDFGNRLKQNGYYEDSSANYDAALNAYYNLLNQYM